MRCRSALLAVMLSVLCHIPGFCQVRFERKYTEGSTHSSETATQIEQKLTIAGMETDTSSDTRAITKSTIGKRDGSGNLRIEEKIESLHVKTTVQGMDYTFDSKNPDHKGTSLLEGMRDVHKALSQRATHVVIGKDNRIQAIEIDQSFLNALPVEVQQLVKSQIDPQHLKQVANQENDRIPSELVSQGDSWTRTENIDFGAGQKMTFQTEYTYQGPIEKNGKSLEKITSKVLTVTYSLQDSPLPLTLKGSDLKAAESDGVVLFDRALGRTVESTSNTRITGDIQFVANNVDLPSKLDLKIKSNTMLLSDRE